MSNLEKQMIAMRYWLLGRNYYEAVRALELATSLHCGSRRDGSPEFSHQLSIAHYLKTISTSLDNPEQVLVIGFLHDALEDRLISKDKLAHSFGDEVARELDHLAKISIHTGEKRDPEYYYSGIARHPASSIVKGADRIHNLETMVGAFSKEKKDIYLTETKELVIPMLKTARRRFPTQELAYQNIKYILENQVRLLNAIQF